MTIGDLNPFAAILDEEHVAKVFAELGPLPATLTTQSGAVSKGSSDEMLRSWITDEKSNLLVLSGGYGSGKTHLLNQVARSENGDTVVDYAFEDIPSLGHLGRASRIFIDHFDEVSTIGGPRKRAPDLRLVSRHLRATKICLVTNRPLTDKSHELVRQLRYRSRLEALGVQGLHLLSVETWPAIEVQQAVHLVMPAAAPHFANIAASLSASELSDLLRPMVLRMLLSIIQRQPENWIPEYGEIYEQYLEHALSWDYDQGRSLLNSIDKRKILTTIAYSMFSGKDNPVRTRKLMTLSRDVIAQKVTDVCVGGRNDEGQDLTTDFLQSNRCLATLDGPGTAGTQEFRFGSKTIFEHFLGHAIVGRYLNGNSLDIPEDLFNPAILDTRMLYFARRALGPELQNAIVELISRTALSNVDRLILLYLVEDTAQFISFLSTAPEGYFTYLAETGQKNDYHFMVKIARFQLVSSGRMSASEYLDYIQLSEEPTHLEVELQLCRTPTGNLDYLERRFVSESLRNSAAISIYRIAQLDPARAKDLLEQQSFLSDVQLRECKDAFQRALESNARRLMLTTQSRPH